MMNGRKLQKKSFKDMGNSRLHSPKNPRNSLLKGVSPDIAAKEKIKYGELVILGYNGFLPGDGRGRQRSKYVLYKRDHPNGVKHSKHYVVSSSQPQKAILESKRHSILWSSYKGHSTVVEFKNDRNTDMFQIGRGSESSIDFVVDNVVPGLMDIGKEIIPSTISRYACRIVANRNDRVTQIYAAGFNSSNTIFLGEDAIKWQTARGDTEGFTTNGVLICRPQGKFCEGKAIQGLWREVSIGGGVFALGPFRRSDQRPEGEMLVQENNVLKDGTLIDICGATLLWRSVEGLEKSPNKSDLEMMVDELNAGKPICPVSLNTLSIPRKLTPEVENCINETQQPYVYLSCGHVQGFHNWGVTGNSLRVCPLCRLEGPVAKLCMGMEPAFYVDSDPPTYAFNPCGHMANRKTVDYWSHIMVPKKVEEFHAVCPFCLTPLAGYPGYTRLIFQNAID